MNVDNLVKLFEAMHISDQPPGSSVSGDVVMVDRPTSPVLSTMPNDSQLWAASVPRVVGAEVSETPGIISQHSDLIPSSYEERAGPSHRHDEPADAFVPSVQYCIKPRSRGTRWVKEVLRIAFHETNGRKFAGRA